MRILVDARSFVEPHGGVGRVGRSLVAAYASSFPKDEILCSTTGLNAPSLPPELSAQRNVGHIHLGVPNKLWSALSMFHATSFDKAMGNYGKTDVAFLPNIGFTGPIGTPSVLLLHDLSFLIEPRWFRWKQRLWHSAVEAGERIRDATLLLAVSETTARDAVRILGIDPERITVIPVGSTHERVEPIQVANLPRRYVLALGADDPRKNAATAVETVRALRHEKGFEDLQLVLLGARETRETWIHPLVRPTDAQLATMYTHASAFLYPSWYEGFGLPLHEAAMYGVPRIASTAGALPETAPPGTYFANPAKPHLWVETLRRVLGAPRPVPTPSRPWREAALILHHALERCLA